MKEVTITVSMGKLSLDFEEAGKVIWNNLINNLAQKLTELYCFQGDK
jgi:hypothetical protein